MTDVFDPTIQSIDDIAEAIMSKLEQYALNLSDLTCTDYLHAFFTQESTARTRGNKKKKVSKPISTTTDEEFKTFPESSWSKAIKNTTTSICRNMTLVKLQHLIVAVAVETKAFLSCGQFSKRLKYCASIVNKILFQQRFIVKKSTKVYRMRALSDQTYNSFVQEIVLEHKDVQSRPGQGDGALEVDDDSVTVDDPAALHDGTTTAHMYFNRCVNQINADIENESYKRTDSKKEEVQKEKLLLKAVNTVVASGKPVDTTNVTLPECSVQVVEQLLENEEASSIALLDPLTIATTTSSSPTVRSTITTSSVRNNTTKSSTSQSKNDLKVTLHKMNLMNQTKNLDIALKEADNSEKALIVQEKEIDLRKQQLLVDSEERKNSNKLFSTVLSNLMDKKDDSQDIFI